jgi:hypothetical protein
MTSEHLPTGPNRDAMIRLILRSRTRQRRTNAGDESS